jgi:glycosyltransferase involved in cell wall biosynthesis/SAM-dependent methyltransferase
MLPVAFSRARRLANGLAYALSPRGGVAHRTFQMSTTEPKGAAEASSALSVLMLGNYSSPHIEHVAVELTKRGHAVHLAGFPSDVVPQTIGDGTAASITEAPPVGDDVLGAARWVRELTEATGADLLPGHTLHPVYATGAAVSDAAPLVITPWGSDLLLPKPPERVQEDRLAVRLADAFTADSRVLAQGLIELGAEESRVRLIRWGVDLDLFKPAREKQRLRDRLGLGPGPVIISPRLPKPLYNVATIIEAFERIADQDPSAQLVIKHFVVEPPDVSGSRHRDRIHLVGEVPYERMADYYAAADACVSIPSSDSSPRSVWEAMACGCPCVISDLPWVGELIEAGYDALVVPIEAAPVEEALRRVLTDPELRESLSTRGRALAEKHHDSRREMDRLEETYRDVAERKRQGERPTEWEYRSGLDPLAAVLDPADPDGRKNRHIHRIHSRALLKFARFGRDDHVLDFGCGNGRLSEVIATRAGRVTGVDVSAGMIKSARERSDDERCEFVVYDGEHLPFADATFDDVVTAVTLQLFCSEPERFRAIISEIARTLRPGAGMWMIERMVPTDADGEWSAERWREEIESCGVHVERIRPVRTGALTRVGYAVLHDRFPDLMLGPAARLDLALAGRDGVRAPYTECLIEARR